MEKFNISFAYKYIYIHNYTSLECFYETHCWIYNNKNIKNKKRIKSIPKYLQNRTIHVISYTLINQHNVNTSTCTPNCCTHCRTIRSFSYYLLLILKKIKENNTAGKNEKCLFQISNFYLNECINNSDGAVCLSVK